MDLLLLVLYFADEVSQFVGPPQQRWNVDRDRSFPAFHE
jgi:hypothetical protein